MKGTVRRVRDRGEVDGKPYWHLSVSLGFDRGTNRYRRYTKGFRGSKRDADRLLRQMVAEVEGGRVGGSARTVGDLLERWFEAGVSKKGLPWSPTTARRYRNLLDNHILHPIYGVGGIQLRKLTVHDLDELYANMGRQDLSPASIRQAHAIIHRALGEAVRKEWVPGNVASSAAPPGVPKPKLTVPSTDEVLRLFDEAARSEKQPALAAFIFVASTTGMRRGELCGLQWRDVDLQRRAVNVHQAVIDTKAGLVLKDTKTHAAAWLALDAATVDVLAAHRAAMDERAAALETAVAPDGFVWSNELDMARPWSPDVASRAFTRLRNRLGLTHVHLHSLRHWAATSAIAGGEDIRTVAGRLRHAKTSTTLDVYSGFIAARDQQVADRLGSLLSR